MGCSQSKTTTDEVVECVSEDAFAAKAPANTDTSVHVVAVADPPATTKEPLTVRASVPIDDVEEEQPAAASTIEGEVKKEVEFAAAPVEEEIEQVVKSAVAHVEKIVETGASSPVKETPILNIDASAEEIVETPAPVEETPAYVEEVVETSASVEMVAVNLEEKGFKEEVEAFTLQSAPLVDNNVPNSTEAETEASVKEKDEPKSEVVAVAPGSETKAVESSLIFKAKNVTFNDKGVAFYNFDGSNLSNSVNDVHISKRYSDFKALHAQLTGKDGKMTDLPALPAASFLQGRNNRKMLEDRKNQFTILLNAIAANPLALQSDVFKAFLA